MKRFVLPVFVFALLILVLALWGLWQGFNEEPSTCFLDFVSEKGMQLYAPLDEVNCSNLQKGSESGAYSCEDIPKPDGLLRISIFTKDDRLIHAVELEFDPLLVNAETLVNEIERNHPKYKPVHEEEALVLFVSHSTTGNGLTYLAIVDEYLKGGDDTKLLMILLTEEAQQGF